MKFAPKLDTGHNEIQCWIDVIGAKLIASMNLDQITIWRIESNDKNGEFVLFQFPKSTLLKTVQSFCVRLLFWTYSI